MQPDIIATLRCYSWSTTPPMPGFNGRLAMWGKRGPIRFIVSEDHSGQIELSLSLAGPKRPTDAHCSAFFRAIGAQPVETIRARNCMHFVMRAPREN